MSYVCLFSCIGSAALSKTIVRLGLSFKIRCWITNFSVLSLELLIHRPTTSMA